jgi:hypothetical protein
MSQATGLLPVRTVFGISSTAAAGSTVIGTFRSLEFKPWLDWRWRQRARFRGASWCLMSTQALKTRSLDLHVAGRIAPKEF